MPKVTSLHAREILDSRGNPTIEVDLQLDSQTIGRAAVPSGASTGAHEAVELRDNDPGRYGGKGVLGAVKNVNETLASAIVGKEFDQQALDRTMIELDGTDNKSQLGANAILGVSLAFAHAAAKLDEKELFAYFHEIASTKAPPILPVPMMNVLNGGRHAEHSTDIQEFMIVPAGAASFREVLRYGTEVFHALKKILSSRSLSTTVGDEGGFAPSLPSNEAALQLIMEAIEKAGFTPGKEVLIAIDAAASEFYKDGKYHLTRDDKVLDSQALIELYADWINKYPIVSIEDGLDQDDWSGFRYMTELLGNKLQIVGDDLFVTNIKRLQQGIDKAAANAILIKPNQIGTVTETIETIKLANSAGYRSIVSHRSGETEDTTIADFTVGLATGQIKTGAPSRGERVAKYNQLLRIEEALGAKAKFPGMSVFQQ